jgi:phage-related protein
MEQVPGRITTSLGLLAAASGPSLERIAKKADEVSVRITESLTESFESGELERAIDGALDVFAQMGRIVRNIFGGLGNIIGGVTTEAGSLFFILEELSGAFERLTASEEFQTILQAIVRIASALVETALPLLQEAFEQLAPVIEEIAPPLEEFIRQVGPELRPLLEKLGPILLDLAEILKEQMPFAIEFTKAALQTLTFILGLVHKVLENFVLPAVRKVAEVLNSQYVKAIAAASRETSDRIGNIVQRFERFRTALAEVLRQSAGRLWDFIGSVGRFAQGIANSMGEVIDTFRGIPGAIRAAVGDLGGILWDAGWRVIGGLIAGVRARIGELRALLNSVTNMIPDWKGPAERDATLLTPNGRLIMEGLIAGIDATTGQLRSRLADITRSLPGMLAIPGITGGPLNLAGPGLLPAPAPAAAGGHTFNLYRSDASPDGILRAMSWRALVGGTSG